MLKRIHVNRHHIAANRKDGGSRLIYTVKTYKKTYPAHEVWIYGQSKMVDGQTKPLNCGAVAWVETHAKVLLIDESGDLKELT